MECTHCGKSKTGGTHCAKCKSFYCNHACLKSDAVDHKHLCALAQGMMMLETASTKTREAKRSILVAKTKVQKAKLKEKPTVSVLDNLKKKQHPPSKFKKPRADLKPLPDADETEVEEEEEEEEEEEKDEMEIEVDPNVILNSMAMETYNDLMEKINNRIDKFNDVRLTIPDVLSKVDPGDAQAVAMGHQLQDLLNRAYGPTNQLVTIDRVAVKERIESMVVDLQQFFEKADDPETMGQALSAYESAKVKARGVGSMLDGVQDSIYEQAETQEAMNDPFILGLHMGLKTGVDFMSKLSSEAIANSFFDEDMSKFYADIWELIKLPEDPMVIGPGVEEAEQAANAAPREIQGLFQKIKAYFSPAASLDGEKDAKEYLESGIWKGLEGSILNTFYWETFIKKGTQSTGPADSEEWYAAVKERYTINPIAAAWRTVKNLAGFPDSTQVYQHGLSFVASGIIHLAYTLFLGASAMMTVGSLQWLLTSEPAKQFEIVQVTKADLKGRDLKEVLPKIDKRIAKDNVPVIPIQNMTLVSGIMDHDRLMDQSVAMKFGMHFILQSGRKMVEDKIAINEYHRSLNVANVPSNAQVYQEVGERLGLTITAMHEASVSLPRGMVTNGTVTNAMVDQIVAHRAQLFEEAKKQYSNEFTKMCAAAMAFTPGLKETFENTNSRISAYCKETMASLHDILNKNYSYRSASQTRDKLKNNVEQIFDKLRDERIRKYNAIYMGLEEALPSRLGSAMTRQEARNYLLDTGVPPEKVELMLDTQPSLVGYFAQVTEQNMINLVHLQKKDALKAVDTMFRTQFLSAEQTTTILDKMAKVQKQAQTQDSQWKRGLVLLAANSLLNVVIGSRLETLPTGMALLMQVFNMGLWKRSQATAEQEKFLFNLQLSIGINDEKGNLSMKQVKNLSPKLQEAWKQATGVTESLKFWDKTFNYMYYGGQLTLAASVAVSALSAPAVMPVTMEKPSWYDATINGAILTAKTLGKTLQMLTTGIISPYYNMYISAPRAIGDALISSHVGQLIGGQVLKDLVKMAPRVVPVAVGSGVVVASAYVTKLAVNTFRYALTRHRGPDAYAFRSPIDVQAEAVRRARLEAISDPNTTKCWTLSKAWVSARDWWGWHRSIFGSSFLTTPAMTAMFANWHLANAAAMGSKTAIEQALEMNEEIKDGLFGGERSLFSRFLGKFKTPPPDTPYSFASKTVQELNEHAADQVNVLKTFETEGANQAAIQLNTLLQDADLLTNLRQTAIGSSDIDMRLLNAMCSVMSPEAQNNLPIVFEQWKLCDINALSRAAARRGKGNA